MLVLDQLHSDRSSREAHHQIITEAVGLVVPTAGELAQVPPCKVRVLVDQQSLHQIDIDVVLSGGPHCGELARFLAVVLRLFHQ